MENASKALIIAGAILLSILIIALGIYVFNMAKGATNTNQLDSVEKSSFNDPFTNYEGKQIGTSVKQLITYAISNATTNADSDEKLPDIRYIDANSKGNKMNVGGTTGWGQGSAGANLVSNVTNANIDNMSSLRKQIAASHYYTVSFDYDNATGLVNLITIEY